MQKYKVGEPIIFAYTYGEPNSEGKCRYGSVEFGVINDVQYVESRDSYLYTIVKESNYEDFKPVYIIRNEGYIFRLDEIELCRNKIKECIYGELLR